MLAWGPSRNERLLGRSDGAVCLIKLAPGADFG
jgi:hypothetical protein